MESIKVSAEELIKWYKWFCAWNEYMEHFHVKRMKKFGHRLDEEEDGISENEEPKEDSEKEEKIEEEGISKEVK